MQSGTFNIASGVSGLYLIVDWAETAVNTTANTSTVSVTLKLHHGGLSVAAGADDCALTLGGVTQKWTGPIINQSGINTMTLGTKTFTVAHGSDGKFYGALAASYRLNVNYGGTYVGTISGSGTITLTDIARGLVYIDDGSSFGRYQVWIDNGSAWEQYAPYIDNGNIWELYS